MSGIIAKKLQMTQIVSGDSMVPVTLLHIPKQDIHQVKTKDTDGYEAVVIKVQSQDGKKLKLLKEMYFSDEDKQKAASCTVQETSEEPAEGEEKKEVKESVFEKGLPLTADLLKDVSEVELTSVSKGKGFTGAMKRWNFKGGPGAHGSKFHRALGSIGTRKPRRTKPGKKMHGRHGTIQQTLKNVPIELVDTDQSIIAVRGPVPGARNTFVHLQF